MFQVFYGEIKSRGKESQNENPIGWGGRLVAEGLGPEVRGSGSGRGFSWLERFSNLVTVYEPTGVGPGSIHEWWTGDLPENENDFYFTPHWPLKTLRLSVLDWNQNVLSVLDVVHSHFGPLSQISEIVVSLLGTTNGAGSFQSPSELFTSLSPIL